MSGIVDISSHFDQTTVVGKRSKKHKKSSSVEDEERIISDLRQLRPFMHRDGRCHQTFEHISSSVMSSFNSVAYNTWIKEKLYIFGTEAGN